MEDTLLIIDDDKKLNQLLKDFLVGFGFKVIAASTPEDGLKQLKDKSPDLIILDIMMPGMNGFELCKNIRKTSFIPIIMLTARGDVTDKIVGLELGADDYMPKPFEPRELVARIQSILRRSRKNFNSGVKTFGRLVINFQKQKVLLDGETIDLTTNEFAALSLLVKNPGAVYNRDQILEEMRGIECDAFNRSVDITMSRLRQKLKDNPKSPDFIKTIWGTGYAFIGENPTNEDEFTKQNTTFNIH